MALVAVLFDLRVRVQYSTRTVDSPAVSPWISTANCWVPPGAWVLPDAGSTPNTFSPMATSASTIAGSPTETTPQ